MKELGQILDSLDTESGGVLATVVQVKGSAYRRPGARMLILPSGSRIGSVSGGCLENDLARKAWWLTEDGRPALRTYDTTSDEDAIWEFGLGCNGVIDVLLERVDSAETSAVLRYLADARAKRQTAAIATVIRGLFVGARLWLTPYGPRGALRGSALGRSVEPLLRTANGNEVVTVADSQVFLERIEPAQPLVLFGAGHDAMPLVNLAAELGWRVTVADGRPSYATAERFPNAAQVAAMHPVRPLDHLEIPPESAVVLMTHNYPQDRALLPGLLELPLRYLGILGPRSRTDRLFAELNAQPPPHLYAPVGLDLGAGSPETIALAIVAEIAAVIAHRPGSMLRDRKSTIYDHANLAPTPFHPRACSRAMPGEVA